MYNTTTGTSITLLITLLFQLVVYECISWYPNWSSAGIPTGHQLVVHCMTPGVHILHTKYSYKHLNILVMLLFTSKVAPGLCSDVY